MKKIDFLIAGVQKSATTSLAYYLGQHPRICKHKSREMPYFSLEEEYKLGYLANFKRYFNHCSNNDKILAKSVTVIQDLEVIKKVYKHNSDMKLVVVLRNPIDRAYSAFWFARKMGWESIDNFEEALELEDDRISKNMVVQRNTSYKKNGEYLSHLNNLFSFFPKEQVYILLQEDLENDANKVCQQLFRYFALEEYQSINMKRINESAMPRFFLIAKLFNANNPLKKKIKQALPLVLQRFIDKLKFKIMKLNNKNITAVKMSVETRKNLSEYYKEMNKELSLIIKRDLNHWNIIEESVNEEN